MEFEFFFDSYVHGFMLHDVGREIAAAHRDENASNFLCALGLLCYTETLGKWVSCVDPSQSRASFEAFFKRLGESYAAFLASGENPYDFYRNGMVHEYLAKGRCEIAMIDNPCVHVGLRALLKLDQVGPEPGVDQRPASVRGGEQVAVDVVDPERERKGEASDAVRELAHGAIQSRTRAPS